MFGKAGMREIRESVGRYAAGFDPALVSGADAEVILADAIAAENMLAAIRSMAGARVAECASWKREGDRSAAHQLARKAGIPLGRAQEALSTAERLSQQPELDGALRRGELSPSQAAPISSAVKANPGAEKRLVGLAKRSSLKELDDECSRTKAAALPDEQARQKEIHRRRFLCKRRTADGAGELVYRSTLEETEEIFSVARGFANRLFHKARVDKRDEPTEAYLADGLLFATRAGAQAAAKVQPDPGPFAEGAGEAPTTSEPDAEGPEPLLGQSSHTTCGPVAAEGGAGADWGDSEHDHHRPAASDVPENAADAPLSLLASAVPDPLDLGGPAVPYKILVRVDFPALLRGYPVEGEVCEIAGSGPVSTQAVKDLVARGGYLATVLTEGEKVTGVVNHGRQVTAAQRTALEWLHPTCSVEGCAVTARREIDHRLPWADTHYTVLELLEWPCDHHHDLKTYKGWDFVEGVGKRPLVPPEDPRHPKHATGPPEAEAG